MVLKQPKSPLAGTSYTPIIEELLERVTALETQVAALNAHQHQVADPTGRHSHLPSTRPIGYASKR